VGRAVSCFAPHGEVSIATGGVGGNRDLALLFCGVVGRRAEKKLTQRTQSWEHRVHRGAGAL
jgi:hypothetical protein